MPGSDTSRAKIRALKHAIFDVLIEHDVPLELVFIALTELLTACIVEDHAPADDAYGIDLVRKLLTGQIAHYRAGTADHG